MTRDVESGIFKLLKERKVIIINHEECKFNLVDMPWIKVRWLDERVEEVSLQQVLNESDQILELAGESNTQNAAVLRWLLAITITLLYRFSEEGVLKPLEDESEALERWKAVWDNRKFSEKAVNDYLKKFYDKFWLISDDHPFMQTDAACKGTEYATGKLDGCLLESSNKPRLFQMKYGQFKNEIGLADASRWLINLNAFDDTSAKASKEYKESSEKKSPGAGWLGKLGLVFAKGETLFETLMLNSILLNRDLELYNSPYPAWENETPSFVERREINLPDNLPELLTLSSRRIRLKINENGNVTGYFVIGGDFFQKENAFIEPFTMWRKKGGKKDKAEYVPARHTPGRQIWRDFGNIVPKTENMDKVPGIMKWISILETEDILPDDYFITLETPSVFYGDKDFFVQDLGSQNMTLYGSLLKDKGVDWREEIENQISKIDKLAFATGILAKEVALSEGKTGEQLNDDLNYGKNLAYHDIDRPFQLWISQIAPTENNISSEMLEQVREKWESTARRLAAELLAQVVKKSGALMNKNALLGRSIKSENDDQKVISLPDAEMKFRRMVSKIYPVKSEIKGKDNEKS